MGEQARRKIGALVRAMAGRCRHRDFAIAGIEIRSKGYRTIPALFGMMQVCCQLFCRSSRTMATVISSWRAPLRRTALAATERFLPYVDNWAVCDSFSPKVFAQHKPELLPAIRRWLSSDRTYTVRYGIGMLMRYYLDDAFRPEYLAWVAAVHSEEYYVNMMRAWYFATALAKQPAAALPWLTDKRLDVWTHNKTIQKAVESYRIPPEQKQALRALRIRSQKLCEERRV